MGETTGIEWCDATFNPWHGCMKVSQGCSNCYAEVLTNRWGGNYWGPVTTTDRKLFGDKHWAEPIKWNLKAQKEGSRKKVFCASMADVFEMHPDVRQSRARLVKLIEDTPHLIWLLLTKRPENVMPLLEEALGSLYLDAYDEWPQTPGAWLQRMGDRVWIGTSVEDQANADKRIPHLLAIPAAIRFLSVEPLLGPIDLWGARYKTPEGGLIGAITSWQERSDSRQYKRSMGVDWVIVGGESGPGARPMHPDWVRQIRDDCGGGEVPFFFKQWGEFLPIDQQTDLADEDRTTPKWYEAHGTYFYKAGKKKAGRLLDGQAWGMFPEARTTAQAVV